MHRRPEIVEAIENALTKWSKYGADLPRAARLELCKVMKCFSLQSTLSLRLELQRALWAISSGQQRWSDSVYLYLPMVGHKH